HRYVPPCPTRRSSDLAEGTPVSGTAASEKDWEARLWEDSVLLPYAGDAPRPSPLGDEEDAPRPPAPTPIRARTDDGPAGIRRPEDRQSTRLKPSPQKI